LHKPAAVSYRCLSSAYVVRSSVGEMQYYLSYLSSCPQDKGLSALCQRVLQVRTYRLIYYRSVSYSAMQETDFGLRLWLSTRSYFFWDITVLKLSQPTGYVIDQQFNIQQLYALPTPYLCVLYLSENKQRLVPLTA